jgi:hypothetical protein
MVSRLERDAGSERSDSTNSSFFANRAAMYCNAISMDVNVITTLSSVAGSVRVRVPSRASSLPTQVTARNSMPHFTMSSATRRISEVFPELEMRAGKIGACSTGNAIPGYRRISDAGKARPGTPAKVVSEAAAACAR